MLITIFGDLAQNPNDEIDGPLLTRMTDRLDIKSQAVRVALHRLRQDDWIISEKHGRTASHKLTASGRAQSIQASKIIYAAQEDLEQSWQVILTERVDQSQKTDFSRRGFVQVAPRVHVAPGNLEPPANTLTLKGTTAPDWVGAQIFPSGLTQAYKDLNQKLEHMETQRLPETTTQPLEVAVLRALIVHHWRRLVLRHPYLPPAVTGTNWPGHLCRRRVTALLSFLPRPSLDRLARH